MTTAEEGKRGGADKKRKEEESINLVYDSNCEIFLLDVVDLQEKKKNVFREKQIHNAYKILHVIKPAIH